MFCSEVDNDLRRCCLQVCRLWKHRITNLALVTAFLCLVRVMLGHWDAVLCAVVVVVGQTNIVVEVEVGDAGLPVNH